MAIIDTIYKALCACFGLQPSSEEAAALFCEAYPEGESIPQVPRNKDIIFYWEEPAPGAKVIPQALADRRVSSFYYPEIFRFPEHLLHVTCYGPNSLENAEKIQALLFLDGGNNPRRILRREGIYLIPDPAEPFLSYEQEGSRWRKRADITIHFRTEEHLVSPVRKQSIVFPPAVQIVNGRGGS